MRILFITTQNPKKQGDLLEVSLLHGLRTVLGDDCVDYPRKKIMYHDFSDTSKDYSFDYEFILPDQLMDNGKGENRINQLFEDDDLVL